MKKINKAKFCPVYLGQKETFKAFAETRIKLENLFCSSTVKESSTKEVFSSGGTRRGLDETALAKGTLSFRGDFGRESFLAPPEPTVEKCISRFGYRQAFLRCLLKLLLIVISLKTVRFEWLTN